QGYPLPFPAGFDAGPKIAHANGGRGAAQLSHHPSGSGGCTQPAAVGGTGCPGPAAGDLLSLRQPGCQRSSAAAGVGGAGCRLWSDTLNPVLDLGASTVKFCRKATECPSLPV